MPFPKCTLLTGFSPLLDVAPDPPGCGNRSEPWPMRTRMPKNRCAFPKCTLLTGFSPLLDVAPDPPGCGNRSEPWPMRTRMSTGGATVKNRFFFVFIPRACFPVTLRCAPSLFARSLALPTPLEFRFPGIHRNVCAPPWYAFSTGHYKAFIH